MRTVTTAAERAEILAGKRIFLAGKPLPQKYCTVCGEFKAAVMNPVLTKDPRRHLIDEKGRIWFGMYCPDCWETEHYVRYRSNLERKALAKGKTMPRAMGPGGKGGDLADDVQ